MGRNNFHVRYINRSYRIRGKVPRIHRNENASIMVMEIMTKSFNKDESIGIVKKKTLDRSLIIIMLVYSAMKIKANEPLLYSVLNPDTSSDSPSAKSKGVRFVSAKVVVNQTKNNGKNIILIGINLSITISRRFKEL